MPFDSEEIRKFWHKAMLRTSGKYYGGLINFDTAQKKYCYFLSKSKKLSTIIFMNDFNQNIRVLELVNEGNAYVNEEYGLSVSFDYLMQEYSYVHFRSQSQITLFLFNFRTK